jgi:hypothetical protein
MIYVIVNSPAFGIRFDALLQLENAGSRFLRSARRRGGRFIASELLQPLLQGQSLFRQLSP